ncbi:MAG: hypothetical protein ACYTHJ_10725 [Planctomycetota bacterium]
MTRPLLILALLTGSGCRHHDRVHHAAADAIDTGARALQAAMDQYHDDLAAFDLFRMRQRAAELSTALVDPPASRTDRSDATGRFMEQVGSIQRDHRSLFARTRQAQLAIENLFEIAEGLRGLAGTPPSISGERPAKATSRSRLTAQTRELLESRDVFRRQLIRAVARARASGSWLGLLGTIVAAVVGG